MSGQLLTINQHSIRDLISPENVIVWFREVENGKLVFETRPYDPEYGVVPRCFSWRRDSCSSQPSLLTVLFDRLVDPDTFSSCV